MMADSEPWITQLRTWESDGTLDRLYAARAADPPTPVRVKRTDGSISIGRIHEVGFGGRMVTIEFDTSEGARYRHEKTESFLELNPEFGPSLEYLEQ